VSRFADHVDAHLFGGLTAAAPVIMMAARDVGANSLRVITFADPVHRLRTYPIHDRCLRHVHQFCYAVAGEMGPAAASGHMVIAAACRSF